MPSRQSSCRSSIRLVCVTCYFPGLCSLTNQEKEIEQQSKVPGSSQSPGYGLSEVQFDLLRLFSVK